MAKKTVWDPATNAYITQDDGTPDTGTPTLQAASNAVGLTPGGTSDQLGTLEGYDPEYDVATNTYNKGKAQAESDYTFQMNQAQNQFNPMAQQLDKQNRDNILAAQRRAADNGIFYGTPALQSQQKVADQYQQQYGDLLRSLQSAQAQYGQQRADTLGQLGTAWDNAGIRHADVVAQQRTARAAKQAQLDAANKVNNPAGTTTTPTGQVKPAGYVPGTQAATPNNAVDSLFRDWSQELQNPNLSPLVLQNARNVWQNNLMQNPTYAGLLSDPRFDIIRQRLGLM